MNFTSSLCGSAKYRFFPHFGMMAEFRILYNIRAAAPAAFRKETRRFQEENRKHFIDSPPPIC